VTCQFRMPRAELNETVTENIGLLTDELKKNGLVMAGYTFRELNENFNLLNMEPESEELAEPEPVKYVFDVRT